MNISPKYLMELINRIEETIWNEFGNYKNAENYIDKWHFADFEYENFRIYRKIKGNMIDLNKTLHGIDGETLIQMAIDLGIETPNFIPSIPFFKNKLKNSYQMAFNSFEEAFRKIYDQPNISVGLANSTLESIIKYILENDRISVNWNEKDTLYKQTQNILKEFNLFPNVGVPVEIRNIGSGLLNISKNIEDLRSNKTLMHGKTGNNYMISDSLYAGFVVNSVASVGLFLMSFFESNYNKLEKKEDTKFNSHQSGI